MATTFVELTNNYIILMKTLNQYAEIALFSIVPVLIFLIVLMSVLN